MRFTADLALRLCGLTAVLLASSLFTSALRAQNEIRIGYGEAAPGETVQVIVSAQHSLPIDGFSLALTYPTNALRLTNLDLVGTHVRTLNPEFVAPEISNALGVATLGVIFAFGSEVGEVQLEPTEAERSHIIARLTFTVRADAAGGLVPIRLVDGVGSPPATNRLVSGQRALEAELVSGQVFVDSGNVMTLSSVRAICGATPNVTLECRGKHADDLEGFQVGISYDQRLAEVLEVTYTGTDLGRILGTTGQIEFFASEILENRGPLGGRARTGVIFDRVKPLRGQVLPAAGQGPDGHSLLRVRARARAGIDCANLKAIPFLLEDLDLGASLNNTFIVAGRSITPHVEHGSIYFTVGELRGVAIDSLTGAPLRTVTATLDPGGRSVTTGANGAFAFADLAPGTYAVRLDRDGYYPARVTEVIVRGDELSDIGSTPLHEIPPAPVFRNDFRRGDPNLDGSVGLSDAIRIFGFLFLGTDEPGCLASADSNDDLRIDLTDGIYLLNFLFNGGNEPAEPFKECGPEREDVFLGCASFPFCP